MSSFPVPFFRPTIGEDEISAVAECLRSGWLTSGPKCVEFERAFSEYVGHGVEAVAVNSATAALHLGLEALGIGPGDEVIVPTLTFTASAEVVRYLGATPVFSDVDAASLCMSRASIEPLITPLTKALMPVHFAGRMCDMTALRDFADGHGLKIIDDAAHAFPAEHRGMSVGRCGSDVTAFSFYANKTITTGEGGMLVTENPDLAARARIMRLHGIDRDVFNRFTDVKAGWLYDVVAPGFKYNLTDVASALGLVQLRRAEEFRKARELRVDKYDTAFNDLPVTLPPGPAFGDLHSWHLYIVQLTPDAPVRRDEFMRLLQANGIGTSLHYRPLHRMTVWKPFCHGREFPNADIVFSRCASLPLFMSMTDGEQERVIEVVRGILMGELS